MRPHESMAIAVAGATVDNQTRCVHYAGPTDVIAIKFYCCRVYYPCFQCHFEDAGHRALQWPKAEWGDKAILCGVCRGQLTVQNYLDVSSCPACGALFNDGCKLHHHLYFAPSS